MRPSAGGTAETDAARSESVAGARPGDLPATAAMAAARAGLPDPGRALVAGFAPGDPDPGDGERGDRALSRLSAGWSERRHLIVRCGPRLAAPDAAARLRDAGVSAETPALLAAGLGTGRERLLYGSLEDAGHPGFGTAAVLVVPHPGALPMDFAWPPTAAPAEDRPR